MMKLAVMAIFGMTLAAGVQAAPGQACLRIVGGVSRVVATVARPADCCTGRRQCAQFLSTAIVGRPAQAERS